MDEKKEIKKAQAYTLKPTNIAWLAEQALGKSTPEKRVSASALLDELVDQAREKSTNDPSSPPKQKKSAHALETIAA